MVEYKSSTKGASMLRVYLRLFGSGQVPRQAHRVLELEHCRLKEESMVGSITWRDNRSAGKGSSRRRQWFLGSVAISDKRILVYRYDSCLLNLLFSEARTASVDFSTETPGILSICCDAALVEPSASGDVEISFRTPAGVNVCSTIAAAKHRHGIRWSGRAPSR
ncbi:MAG: hypothetical protein ACQESR_22425 [Planctomycetota bacterium]